MKILFLLTIAFVLFGFGSISHSFAVDIITNDNFAVVGEEPEKFKNIWCHGDFAKVTDDGAFVIYGRSDTTLNPGGVRLGTSEIYSVVEKFKEIKEH